jgi:molecular chaperone GrpE
MSEKPTTEEHTLESENIQAINQSEVNEASNADATQVETNEIEQKLQKAEAEIAEWKDKYIRLYSEFENYRTRTSKEKLELIKTASERLILELLPILDDFDRTEKALSNSTDINALKEGIQLVYHKFQKVLEKQGLKAMKTHQEDFNTELHEAITMLPAPEESLKGKIIDEVEKGYFLHEKPIRVAKVVIGQ